MNSINNRRLVMFDSVIEFGQNHPLPTPIARVTVLYGSITGSANTLRTLGSTQVEGRSGVSSAVAESAILRDALLNDVRAINKIARALPRAQFPGVREQFRMPRRWLECNRGKYGACIRIECDADQPGVHRSRPSGHVPGRPHFGGDRV
jgi:hypothetical protein